MFYLRNKQILKNYVWGKNIYIRNIYGHYSETNYGLPVITSPREQGHLYYAEGILVWKILQGAYAKLCLHCALEILVILWLVY